ncbi:MAG: hypothetical protein J5954_00740 [Prevotella sp.]|nr:hypothetical protein [Prevotella sp.]
MPFWSLATPKMCMPWSSVSSQLSKRSWRSCWVGTISGTVQPSESMMLRFLVAVIFSHLAMSLPCRFCVALASTAYASP